MSSALAMEMARLRSAYCSGGALGFFFDYDGTLVPLVDHPRLARLGPSAQLLLAQLARLPRMTVGILSGRALEDLKRMTRIDGVHLSGTSGLELEWSGVPITHPRAEQWRPFLETLARDLAPVLARYPGAWLERKPLGMTVHYRAVVAERIAALRRETDQVLAGAPKRMRVVDGALAIEMIPDVGWSKGTALRTMLAEAGSQAISLYAGDDANDREALEAALDHGGVAIGIGPRAPAIARHLLPDPLALLDLVSRFFATLDPRLPLPPCPVVMLTSG